MWRKQWKVEAVIFRIPETLFVRHVKCFAKDFLSVSETWIIFHMTEAFD
jgi:hypothetical protein